jgi:hypothetical protein
LLVEQACWHWCCCCWRLLQLLLPLLLPLHLPVLLQLLRKGLGKHWHV